MVSKYPKMNKLFKGQISFQAVFSKCAQARYYHGILAATDKSIDWFIPLNSLIHANVFAQNTVRLLASGHISHEFGHFESREANLTWQKLAAACIA